MRKILIYILLLTICSNLYAEDYSKYFYNDSVNKYFYKLIHKKHKKSKTIVYLNYTRGVDEKFQYTYAISNSGKRNHLTSKEDSIKIFKYIINNDSLFFQTSQLINAVKQNKAQYYIYYDRPKQYNHSTIDSIYYFPIDFLKEYDPFEYRHYTELLHTNYITLTLENSQYYKLILNVKYKHNKIKSITPLGIILFIECHESSLGKYIGMLGVGCFVFK